jgi:hypothetical protein
MKYAYGLFDYSDVLDLATLAAVNGFYIGTVIITVSLQLYYVLICNDFRFLAKRSSIRLDTG